MPLTEFIAVHEHIMVVVTNNKEPTPGIAAKSDIFGGGPYGSLVEEPDDEDEDICEPTPAAAPGDNAEDDEEYWPLAEEPGPSQRLDLDPRIEPKTLRT